MKKQQDVCFVLTLHVAMHAEWVIQRVRYVPYVLIMLNWPVGG